MNHQQIIFVGTSSEVGHHAAPIQNSALAKRFPVSVATPAEAVQRAQPADLVVFFSEHFDRFRHAIGELKSRNVATLYMIDGILEWRNAWENRVNEPACPWTMRPVLSHKVAAIGASQARVLNSWGNDSKVEITGIPRFDSLRASQQEKQTGTPEDVPKRVLVMTAKWPGFNEQQLANAERCLRDLKDWFSNQETESGIPIHPIWRLTQGMHEKIGVENQLTDLSGSELAQTLQQVDAVVTMPSTAMLESMLANVPTAVIDYNGTPQYVRAAWNITATEQVGSTMKQLLAPDARRSAFQNWLMQDALHLDPDESSTERFCQLAESMLNLAAEQVAKGRELPEGNLTFPANILPRPKQILCNFEHRELFPNHDAFAIVNPTELQAELAHARREIQHLHREMEQLQSELNQAHQIFESIQKHPVAGPVVRARQKLLDWVATFKDRRRARKQSRAAVSPTPSSVKPSNRIT